MRSQKLHVLVTLKAIDRELLRRYEQKAFGIIREHGGKILSAFSPSVDAHLDEIHLVEFPSLEHFERYRKDFRLENLADEREKAVRSATVIMSESVHTSD